MPSADANRAAPGDRWGTKKRERHVTSKFACILKQLTLTLVALFAESPGKFKENLLDWENNHQTPKKSINSTTYKTLATLRVYRGGRCANNNNEIKQKNFNGTKTKLSWAGGFISFRALSLPFPHYSRVLCKTSTLSDRVKCCRPLKPQHIPSCVASNNLIGLP